MRKLAIWILVTAVYLGGAWIIWTLVGTAVISIVALALAAESYHKITWHRR